MGRVDAFKLPGVQLWFYSSDHAPPHFHAKRSGEWEIRVYFLLPPSEMWELKWTQPPSSGPKRKQLHQLVSLAERRRAELLLEWEAKVIHDE